MPPRRGGRRGRGAPQRGRNPQQRIGISELEESQNVFLEDNQVNDPKCDATSGIQNGTEATSAEVKVEPKSEVDEETQIKVEEEAEPSNVTMTTDTEEKSEKAGEKENEAVSVDLPFKVKVSHLPAAYVLPEFQKYLRMTLDITVPKIISPVAKNSPWLLLPFATKEEQENCIRLLHNHIWKKKALRAIAFYGMNSQKHPCEGGDDPESKRMKLDEVPMLTLEEEILSESLPLYSVSYEEQNRLTILDVQLLSNKLHAFMCVRNPALAGWAEAMTEQNEGSIFKIEPLKASPLLEGYRNKCKFRIGKNTEGETTVGFCLNDNENKILGVQPGDKLIHLPDSMKYAAKKFEDFIRASGKEPYDKKQKSGFWDHIIIRIAPEGSLMLVVVMYHNQLPEESIAEIKNNVKEFFVNGDGKDCKLYSLYFQIMNDKAPMLPPDKLELLHGETHFYENICGLKFYVGPFSILNVNSSSSENIYKSIAELAEPTPETTIIDLCSGTGGIAFTIADKCKNVIAIESQEDHIKDALKTKEINNIQNVEFIKGKVEDELAGVFEKLGDAPVIPIIDPPRQGLVQKAISQLRARESIKKLVYVCSNSKMGAKNFLDLCASAEKKEGTFGNPLNVVFAGLPFLPIRAIPVDVAPYTVNNTIIILFERIDPSTYPPAKNPPPLPLKRPQSRKEEKKKKRNQGRRMRTVGIGGRGRKFRMQGAGMRGGFGGQNFRRGGQHGGFNQNRFPPPLLRSMDPALSLVAKYERRIAELEQQDRAFKAGLTMGLQALGGNRGASGGGGGGGGGGGNFENFGNSFDQNMGNVGNMGNNNNFGNFRGQFPRDRSGWQRSGGRNFGNMGTGFRGGNNNFNSGFMGGGFNNFNNGGGFGNFGGGGGGGGGSGGGGGNLAGGGGGNFNSGFGGGGGGNFNSGFGGGGGGFRNYQGNKHRR